MLTLARSNEHLSAKELEAKESRMRLLADCAHMAFSRAYHQEAAAALAEKLSMREAEVLRWHADGKTAEEIGIILRISIDTVKFHTRNAVAKLGASNKTSAVVRAAMMGLLA
jgi:LuxR family quorum-sensing system transcriptional regulator SolR